jgi:lauroyl/myristoyl acyltransferase
MEAIKRSYSSNKNRLHEEKIRKALSLDRNSAVPQHIRVAGDANRTEHSIQIFREYGGSAWTPPIRIEGINYLKDAVSKQKGVVLWASHFAFSSLITKKALAAAGYSVSHLSRPEHGFSKSRFGIAWLNPFRCAVEDRYLAQRVLIQRDVPGGAFQSALEILSHGGAVSVTAGAWEGRILAEGDFLAGKIHLAIGAAKLSSESGAELLPVFTIRDSMPNSFLVVIGRPLLLHGGEAAISVAVREYLTALAPFVVRYPDQWRGWDKLIV